MTYSNMYLPKDRDLTTEHGTILGKRFPFKDNEVVKEKFLSQATENESNYFE